MKNALLIAFILTAISSPAQIKRIVFKVAANHPFIAEQEESVLMTIPVPLASVGYTAYTLKNGLSEHYDGKVGFDLGGGIDYAVGQRFFFHTGLNASYLRYKKMVKVHAIDGMETLPLPVGPAVPGKPFGEIVGGGTRPHTIGTTAENLGETTTLYMQVPVMFGASVARNKLLFRAGTTLSLLARATTYRSLFVFNANGVTLSEYQDKTTDGYTSFLVAATAHATYMVTGHVGIDITASKFLTPIYTSEQRSAGKAKYAVISLGVSYSIAR